MKGKNVLKAKINLHGHFNKGCYYEISDNVGMFMDKKALIVKGESVSVFFYYDSKYHKDDINDIIQVGMYIWDYFYTLKEERREKLEKLNLL